MGSSRSVGRVAPLQLRVAEQDGGVVVYVAGELDLSTHVELAGCLDQFHGPVIVDLADVTFADSDGIGVLALTHRRLKRHGAGLQLRAPRSSVSLTLSIAGLGYLLTD
jgi:anti-sigma B factor antagonist